MFKQISTRRQIIATAILLGVLVAVAALVTTSAVNKERFDEQRALQQPRLVQTQPGSGEELPLDGTIQLRFDRPMNRASVEQAVSFDPPIPFAVHWDDDFAMTIRPEAGVLKPASHMVLTVASSAASAKGFSLLEPRAIKLDTAGFLRVTDLSPTDKKKDVGQDTLIRVMFNRPVVRLTLANNQTINDNPLTFTPPIEGSGSWVNTSIYEYRPSGGLHSGQTYVATVNPALTDTGGARLDKLYRTAFTVAAPKVLDVFPDSSKRRDDYYYGSPDTFPLDTSIEVAFNMPMDRASTENALLVANKATGIPTYGSFTWNDDSTRLTFKPRTRLDLGSEYEVTIGVDARSADGYGQLEKKRTTRFKSAPAPAIDDAGYASGGRDISPNYNDGIGFNTLMDEDSLIEDGRVTISPAPLEKVTLTATTYGYWSRLYIRANLRGNTTYTLTVNPGARDIYGNVITEPKTYSFTTRAYYPKVQINTGGRYGVYDASQPTRIILATRAISKIDFSLYKLSVSDLNKARNRYTEFTPAKKNLLRSWTENLVPLEDEAQITPIAVAPDGDALPPGIYYLKASYNSTRYDNSRDHILFVANANLTYKHSPGQAMVWLTDLHTARPLGGVPVTVYTGDNSGSDGKIKETAAVTAGDGTAAISLPPRTGDPYTYYDDYYGPFAYAIADDGKTFAASLTTWDDGISPSDFGMSSQFYTSEQTLYLHTDRPIYRPGQEIFFRGILRDRDDMIFSLPETKSVSVVISRLSDNGYDTEAVTRQTYSVDELGLFHGSFGLPEDASLGRYYIKVETDKQRNEQQSCAYVYYCGSSNDAHFDVSEYRKPEFDVKLTPEHADILSGDTTSVTLDAAFFSGGPVSNAKVKWQVKDYASAFTYTGPGRYRFADYVRYWSYFYYDDFYGYSEEEDIYNTIASGEAQTDADGRLVIPFTTSALRQGTHELRIEAEVSDIGGVAVTGVTTITAHDAQYQVGIASDTYWGPVAQPQTMNLIVVDWAGNPAPGQQVSVQLSRQSYVRERTYNEYGTVRWEWTTTDEPVGDPQTAITDEKGQAAIAVTPPNDGSYRVRATVTDPHGKSQSSSAFVWASSYSYTLLRSSKTDDQTDIIADRASYQPGDTASILINNPFQGEVQALLTVEREHVLSHQVLTLSGGAVNIQLPITPDLAPDVYVSVTLLKGIDETSPTPDFKMGLTKLKVLPTAQTLIVTVTPKDKIVRPGEPADFHVQVTDLAGRPASAQVSMALVDAAVLKLAKPNSINILDHFYGNRLLGVNTAQPLTALVNRLFVEVIPDDEAGGMGGGGGGGPSLRQPDQVRENFKDTAYWNATIQTDASGGADVTIPLPDNLTIWRLDARAVTPDTHVGQGEAEIQTTLPLLIRPETPRFFIAGDRATLSAIVNNNTDSDITAVVRMESQGLTLEGDASQTVVVPAHNRQMVAWPVIVSGDTDWVDVIFHAEGGGYSDAARPEIGDAQHNRNLPVFRYTVYEPVATAGQLTYGSKRTEYVSLPPGLDTSKGSLSVQVQHSLAASTLDGLTWLEHYPYECNEQFTSRLLPNSITLAALKDLGVADLAMETRLTDQRDIGVKTLLDRQRPGGGWGLWPEDDPNTLATAYVLHGLIEAHKAGAELPAVEMRRAIKYLVRWVDGTPDKLRGGTNLKAYVVYVLSRTGELNPPEGSSFQKMPEVKSLDKRIGEIYDDREKLNTYAKALLAQAIWNRNPADLRLITLRSELTESAIISATMVHWEEESQDYWNWNTDIRTTAVVLDTFVHIWPDSELGPGAVRWLVAARKTDHWPTTQETAWSLLALTDWMRITHELQGDYPWTLTVGGQKLAGGSATPASLLKTTTVTVDLAQFLTEDSFTIERGDGSGRLYYTGQMLTYPDVETVTQVSHGVSISHRYLDAAGSPVGEARVGDTLTVEVTIVAPNDLYYPIVEDYYPAGTDPIDPDLLSQPLGSGEVSLEGSDRYGWRWGWSRFNHIELRDEKAVLSTDFLASGTYVLRYQVRVTTPGLYHVIPPTIQEFYVPDVYGRGDGLLFQIYPAQDQ